MVWVDRFDDETCGGLCDEGKKLIYICKGMGKLRTFEVFIHELFHAVEFTWRLPIPHALIHKLETPIVKLCLLNGWIPEVPEP